MLILANFSEKINLENYDIIFYTFYKFLKQLYFSFSFLEKMSK